MSKCCIMKNINSNLKWPSNNYFENIKHSMVHYLFSVYINKCSVCNKCFWNKSHLNHDTSIQLGYIHKYSDIRYLCKHYLVKCAV